MIRGPVLALLLSAAANGMAAEVPRSHGGHGLRAAPFELSGYIETTVTHYHLNRGSTFYQLEFWGQPQRASLDRSSATLRLTGAARAGEWSFRALTRSTLEHDQTSHGHLNRFDELLASWTPHADFTLSAGKMVARWGKGHTWNPLAFIERPKDPNDPRLPREGYTVISARLKQEFLGALQMVTFNPVLLPVTERINKDFGAAGHLNAAGKLTLDFGTTDTSLYFLSNGSRSGRWGADFSHDVSNDLELYGEWARINTQNFRLITPSGTGYTRTHAARSYLVGLQYRTQQRNNFILELHHNGTGYTTDEFRDFIALVDHATQPGADSALLPRALRLADGGFGRTKAMRDYVYLRVSQRAAPVTPSIRATLNLQDRSYSVTPELLYSSPSHWGLRLRFTRVRGAADSEYGACYYTQRAELRLHYHF